MKKERWLMVMFGILCLVWTAMVFFFSLRNGDASSTDSETALGVVKRFLLWFGIENAPSELFIRKAAHFSEYFLLGVLACAFFFSWKRRLVLLFGEGYAIAVAFIDEFVCQNISVGRGPSFLDVLLDSAGALCGVLIVFLMLRKIYNKISKNA